MVSAQKLVDFIFIFVLDNFIHFKIKIFNDESLILIKILKIDHGPLSQVTSCFAQTVKHRKARFPKFIGGTT